MYDKDLRQRFRFHLEHAGYVVGKRAVCALELARAEKRLCDAHYEEALAPLDEKRCSVEWVDDDAPYDAGDAYTDEEVEAKFESNEWTGPFGCIVKVDGFEASLWGIVLDSHGTGDPYARVVAAELASEVFFELDREQVERERAARQDIATLEVR